MTSIASFSRFHVTEQTCLSNNKSELPAIATPPKEKAVRIFTRKMGAGSLVFENLINRTPINPIKTRETNQKEFYFAAKQRKRIGRTNPRLKSCRQLFAQKSFREKVKNPIEQQTRAPQMYSSPIAGKRARLAPQDASHINVSPLKLRGYGPQSEVQFDPRAPVFRSLSSQINFHQTPGSDLNTHTIQLPISSTCADSKASSIFETLVLSRRRWSH